MAGRVRGAPCWPPWQPLPSRELAPRFIPILLPPPSSLHPPPSPLHPPPSFNLSSISVCLSGAVSDINVDAPEGMSYAEWEASNVRKGGSCCCCWWCCCWRLHDVSLQLIAAATSSGSAGECPCLCPVVAVQLAGGPGAPANPRPDTQLFSAPPSLPPPPPPPHPPHPPPSHTAGRPGAGAGVGCGAAARARRQVDPAAAGALRVHPPHPGASWRWWRGGRVRGGVGEMGGGLGDRPATGLRAVPLPAGASVVIL